MWESGLIVKVPDDQVNTCLSPQLLHWQSPVAYCQSRLKSSGEKKIIYRYFCSPVNKIHPMRSR